VFDGFARVYTEGRDDESEEHEGALPPLVEGDETRTVDVTPTQHFTEPPPRYSEATLIKALEEKGIGRPSTYAAIISTIEDRGYVHVVERRLRPDLVGEIVTDLLVEHFGEFVDPEFTARMEDWLDEIAQGRREWVPLLRDFYGPLRERVDEKRRELRRRDFTTEPSDEVCSLGHPMVIRLGRYGRFLSCSLYPEHQESRPLPGEPDDGTGPSGDGERPAERPLPGLGAACPQCGQGTLVEKRGRFGPFVGCSRYPDCTYIRRDGPPAPPQLPFEVGCPRCGKGHLVARRARRTGKVFWGCSRYPTCDFTTDFEPVGAKHDADAGPVARRTPGDGLCLLCGAAIVLSDGDLAGRTFAGGPPDPGALAPRRRRGASPPAERRRGGRSGATGRRAVPRRRADAAAGGAAGATGAA
jgi:DNA topoisomerase-1